MLVVLLVPENDGLVGEFWAEATRNQEQHVRPAHDLCMPDSAFKCSIYAEAERINRVNDETFVRADHDRVLIMIERDVGHAFCLWELGSNTAEVCSWYVGT